MLGNFVSRLMPLVPRAIVGRVARRYIAGETLDAAVSCVRALNERGFSATCDLLGEEVSTADSAVAAVAAYRRLIAALSAADCRSGISLKLSQLGLCFDLALAEENLRAVLEAARGPSCFVRIDMEDSTLTTATLDLYRKLRAEFPGGRIGTVVQSYLFRTQVDLDDLLAEPTPPDLRMCKGIYRESPEVAFTNPALITRNFIRLTGKLLSAGARVGIATHDTAIIDALENLVVTRRIPKDQYEFQVLLGVPIERRMDRLVANGHRVRVYVPYGEAWYAYSTRRLRENPEMAGHIFKAMVRRLD